MRTHMFDERQSRQSHAGLIVDDARAANAPLVCKISIIAISFHFLDISKASPVCVPFWRSLYIWLLRKFYRVEMARFSSAWESRYGQLGFRPISFIILVEFLGDAHTYLCYFEASFVDYRSRLFLIQKHFSALHATIINQYDIIEFSCLSRIAPVISK